MGVQDFERRMDAAIIHVLFSRRYFFDISAEEAHVYPLFANEVRMAKCFSRERLGQLLGAYVKILSEFDRKAHLRYMCEVFGLKDECRCESAGDGIKVLFGRNKFDLSSAEGAAEFVRAPPISFEEAYMVEREQSRMTVLLLGSYDPDVKAYVKRLRRLPVSPQNKFRNKKSLSGIERFLLLKEVLETRGFDVVSGKAEKRHIRNVFLRTQQLMQESDYIYILLTNTGGVAMEFGAICENRAFRRKSNVFVSYDAGLSGYATYGALLLPEHRIYRYGDDNELVDLVLRESEALKRRS